MRVADRRERIAALIDRLFDQAERGDYEIDPETKAELRTVCACTGALGLRELVLVVAIARLFDPGYLPATEKLYQKTHTSPYRKPRGVYPDIRLKLAERGIPFRKDGPLNIAKKADRIDESWAAGSKYPKVAEQVVSLARKMEGMSPSGLEEFATAVHACLLEEAERVEALSVEAVPEADPGRLFALCAKLIREAVAGGNTPHRIVGYALEAYHEELATRVEVLGVEDSAWSTNTTGQKPGDIFERLQDGTLVQVYEVTVKGFGAERVSDSYESVKEYDRQVGSDTTEITVLCRREDAHPDTVGGINPLGYLGKLEYQNVAYHFVEIHGWVLSRLLEMPPAARLRFYAKLSSYVRDPSTKEVVKTVWRDAHERLFS